MSKWIHSNDNSLSTMNPAIAGSLDPDGPSTLQVISACSSAPGQLLDPVELTPIDKEVLETTGELPGLPLLVNPALLDRLRNPPCQVHTI